MPPHSICHGGSLDTYSVDVGYSITPEFETSIGYYYQKGDLGKTDGSSVQWRIVSNMGKGFSIGTKKQSDLDRYMNYQMMFLIKKLAPEKAIELFCENISNDLDIIYLW